MNYSSPPLAILLLWFFQKLLRQRQLPFPPGPTPRFLVGNFRDIPTKLPWLTYTKWGLQYGAFLYSSRVKILSMAKGDLVHATALPGHHIVVINSIKVVNELFEKHSHIYSGRPVVPIVELLTAVAIMSIVYGYEVKLRNDRFVALSENAMKKLTGSFFPSAAAVNTFPILRYLPSWMPGAGFQHFAAECHQLTEEMRKVPFDFVKQNMRDGVDAKSVVARLLKANQAHDRYSEVAIQEAAATAYAAAADTTVSTLASFFLAMTVYPDIKKAQTEIDTIIGTHRLPGFEDRTCLPFVKAVYREVLR
ncbi:cytochrome P450 [Mycena galopus ATCC 62051]|nr:cytochrome P450 [Mycena galopus ATCC 62051]